MLHHRRRAPALGAVLLASRQALLLSLLVAGLSLLSITLGRTGILINLDQMRPAGRLRYPEICGLLTAAMAAVLLRPRMWEWDRIGLPRAGGLSVGAFCLGLAASVVVASVGATRLPPEEPRLWLVANAVLLASAVFALSPFLGPAVAGGLVILGYLTLGIATHLSSSLDSVPLTRLPDTEPHWVAAAATAVTALMSQAWTRGSTAWVQRMFARDS